MQTFVFKICNLKKKIRIIYLSNVELNKFNRQIHPDPLNCENIEQLKERGGWCSSNREAMTHQVICYQTAYKTNQSFFLSVSIKV